MGDSIVDVHTIFAGQSLQKKERKNYTVTAYIYYTTNMSIETYIEYFIMTAHLSKIMFSIQ